MKTAEGANGGLDQRGHLVNIFVIEPGDALTEIDAELGFTLVDRPIDVIEDHPCWYELTIVLGDDGSGVVLYVPKPSQ